MFTLAGCTAGPVKPVTGSAAKPTLGTSDYLPKDAIERIMHSPRQWGYLRDLTYEGYVVLSGEIGDDGMVAVHRITRCYPDNSRDAMARALAQGIYIRAASAGSSIPPNAEIYVIFYGEMFEGQVAVVFAKQTTSFLPRNYDDGMFLDIRTY